MSDDVVKYEIFGRTYTQSFLTISETIEVAELLQDIKFKSYQPIEILKTLQESGKLEKLFNIILKGDIELMLDQIKPAIAIKVISDFFVLNDILTIISDITSMMSEMNESGALEKLTETMPTGTN